MLIGESIEMAALVGDYALDMAFLDADHSLEGVSGDLLAWWPKVKLAGWIGGHDYAHPGQGDVKDAVKAWMEKLAEFGYPARLELGQDRTWFIRKTKRAT